MDDRRVLARAYVAQQKEMGMPDIICAPEFDAALLLGAFDKNNSGRAPGPAFAPVNKSPADPMLQRPSAPRLLPVSRLMGAAQEKAKLEPAAAGAHDSVRDALAALYHSTKDCHECGLGNRRTKFVFGSGSPHAKLMIVGEAPGRDEDLQGLPFVGAAGELLTKMLAAIKLDRKKHVFIANVLKCRPPDNRNPESSEILACGRILYGQIDIIKPKVILLLGRIAAHALLKTTASIGALRAETHSVNGIPAYVTYHPASLLRNQAYKRPAWEDMQKLQTVLMGLGVYANES